MNKSESSLFVEKGLKIIESLSEDTTDMLKGKTTGDPIIKPSELNAMLDFYDELK
ncbi:MULTISPECIES: hypothetical protein [Xenorhabdus]|uniref:hypothetical protein n=1 Tax=Xenorhabdus TaxID=626 RepID=UPI000AC70FF9|nr:MULTISPECIES: hypothetical protein [Xenorhabdus]